MKTIACIVFCFALSVTSLSQPVINYVPVVSTGLSSPVDFVHAGDNSHRIFIVERGGSIKVYDSLFNSLGTFLTVTGIATGGEQGLLSMAFHPGYEINGYFFVYYTNIDGDVEIARYKVRDDDPNRASPESLEVLLTMEKNITATNHNGGKMNFGMDGHLYFAVGDAGSSGDPTGNAQNPLTLYGKMARINVDNFTSDSYAIPADNPFVSSSDTLKEIWAFGLRNPWRWSFDRLTGDLWLADVGQGQREEVNFLPSGNTGNINYGWNCFEGELRYDGCTDTFDNQINPIYTYGRGATGGISVTGGYVYRGSVYPVLRGYYVMADYNSGNSWLIRPNGTGGWSTTRQAGSPTQIVSFGETEAGELYMLTLNGTVYQLTSTSVVPVKLTDFKANRRPGVIHLEWRTEAEENVSHYEVQFSNDGLTFKEAGRINATGRSVYTFNHSITEEGKLFYRLRMVDTDNSYEYSKTISLPDIGKGAVLQSNVIIQNNLRLTLSKPFDNAQVIDLNGRIMWQQNISGRSGLINLTMHGIPRGTYVLRLTGKSGVYTERVFSRD